MFKSIVKKLPAIIVCLALSVGTAVMMTACGEDQTTVEKYTITFNANGGTFADNKTTVTATTDDDGKVTLPTDPTRTDYTFDGYNTTADGSGNSVTASTKYSANTTVYAVWTANSTNESGVKDYYFDAECTDLSSLTGDLGSGTAYGREMIVAGERANGGYYVDNFNVVDSTITYKISSENATTVHMSLLISALSQDTLKPELLTIKVNGTAVNYTAGTVTSKTEQVSAIKSVVLFDKFDIGDIQLKEGENIITLTEGEAATASGSGTYKLSLRIDAIVLSSSEKLTWEPIEAKDWDTFYAF
jgi:uncharacterized repeat protein (TIGR02543 family)